MNPINILRRYFQNIERSRQLLEEIREGVANLTDVTNRHLMKLAAIMEAAAADAKRIDAQSARTASKPDGEAEPPPQRTPVHVNAGNG